MQATLTRDRQIADLIYWYAVPSERWIEKPQAFIDAAWRCANHYWHGI